MERKDGEIWRSARETLGNEMLSVVMPVYNLGAEIGANLKAVESVLAGAGICYELVPVDDGSADETGAALRKAAAQDSKTIHPVWVAKNAGKGNALKAGFHAARGSYILLLDGDLDIAPKMLPGFFDALQENGADIVVGSKRHPKSRVQYPWHRVIASKVYFGLVRLFIGLPVTDTQTGMKLFKRRVLGEALERMLVKTYAFDLELLSIAHERGAKIAEAPVEIRFGAKFGCLKVRTVREMVQDTLAVFYRLRLLHYYAHVEVPPPLEKMPRVSVVVACPKYSTFLWEGLQALRRQTYRDFEVIVLPDEPFDAALEKQLQQEGLLEGVRVLATGKVRPAEKRNLGIREATGDVVAFLDDDAYPDEHWLENAVKYFGEPTIGAVGGPGVTPPGDAFLARAGGRVYENIFVSGNYRYRYLGGRVRRDIDDYPSCNLFVRTDLLRKIGGYRTDFWPGEDTLLCDAIVNGEGLRIVYDPWTLVYHHRRALLAAHLRQLGRYGFHRGYFVRRFPATSCKVSYFIPSAFVFYVALAIGAAFLAVPLWMKMVFWAPLSIYGALTILSAFSISPLMWGATVLGIWFSHVWYGIRFLQGLCAKKAPCEFIGKDHGKK